MVVRTHGRQSAIGGGAAVGPFAYLRPGTVLGATASSGAFVETKNSDDRRGHKVPHLTYVGDADIGEHSNIGASSVFVNYDGENKSRTTIGSHVRTGSDTMFVAPVTSATAPTPARAPWSARTCRPARWRCRPASSATSRVGSHANGREPTPIKRRVGPRVKQTGPDDPE